jgi:hypothetical protein
MGLVYNESEARGAFSGKPISQWSQTAVLNAWARHVENHAFLRFMSKKGTFEERMQANKELQICERKIEFWERHSEFDKRQAELILSKVKKNWK